MRKKRKLDEDEIKGDEWLATYSDCVTLLLTFFVLLYSMSSVDQQKLEEIAAAFKSSMGGEKGETIMEYDLYNGKVPLIGGESIVEEMIDESDTEKEEMYNKVKAYSKDNNIDSVIDISMTERGVEIQLSDYILFSSGTADIKEESKIVLDKVSGLLNSIDNSILVEGHTDNVPIKTSDYPSNWELSTARSVNVVKYFVENNNVSPVRLSASGYGEYHPIVPNDSQENRAKNRRVNILITTSDK